MSPTVCVIWFMKYVTISLERLDIKIQKIGLFYIWRLFWISDVTKPNYVVLKKAPGIRTTPI